MKILILRDSTDNNICTGFVVKNENELTKAILDARCESDLWMVGKQLDTPYIDCEVDLDIYEKSLELHECLVSRINQVEEIEV